MVVLLMNPPSIEVVIRYPHRRDPAEQRRVVARGQVAGRGSAAEAQIDAAQKQMHDLPPPHRGGVVVD